MKAARYRFDDYLLDTAARELWRGELRIPIPPKSLECLAYLIQHNTRAVGRDELIAAVWGRVDASDTLLTQTIWRGRRAINDDAQHNLRTVPRFGYRWVAPVRVESIALAQADVPPVASTAMPIPSQDLAPPGLDVEVSARQAAPASRLRALRRIHPRRVLIGAAVLAMLAAGWFALGVRISAPPRSFMVVLPVRVTEPTHETTWIRLGAMDYIASRLRDAHVNVLPSERVVAIAKPAAEAAGPDAAERARIERMTGANYLLVPRAAFSAGTWRFAIDVYHDGHAVTYRAESAMPLPAADLAAARFLEGIHHAVAAGTRPPDDLNEAVQRIDAAMLAGELEAARVLAEHLTPAQRADPRLRVRTGRIAFRTGRLDEAEAAFAPLVAGNAGTPAAIRALAEMGLGGIAIRRHRFDEAEPHYSAALAALGSDADANLLGRAYTERAVVNSSRGRLDLAVADVGRARGELERGGDPLGLASLDLNAALIENQRGHYVEATAMFDRATDVYDRFGIADMLATALAGKVDTQLTVLDDAGAATSSARAWSLLPKLEDRLLIEFMATRHVQALRANGRLAEASRVLDVFDGASEHRSSDPAFVVLRAAVLVDQGKAPLALRLADRIFSAIAQAPAGSCSDTVPEAALVLTEAALQSHRADAASPMLARLQEFAASPQDPEWTFADELSRARLLAAKDDPEAARHFAAALAFADSAGEPARIVAASAAYADYAAARSDRARAAGLLARVEPYVGTDYRAARTAALLHAALGQPDAAEAAQADARTLAGERVIGAP